MDWEQAVPLRFGWKVGIVPKSAGQRVFAPQAGPRCWVRERRFGWLGRYRRLSKDYERVVSSSRAWTLWAMIKKLLQRLGPKPIHPPLRYRSV